MQFKEYRNQLPINTVRTWGSILSKELSWEFSGWSGEAGEPYRHWNCYPKMEEHKYLSDIWEFLDESLKADGFVLRPERIIANLFNHGDSSWLHTDTPEPGSWTVIVYLNDFWDLNWGGETVLIEDNEILKAFAPTPGKFIVFKSDILHGPRPVSREAPFPRFGLTYQCKNDTNLQGLSKPKLSSLSAAL